MEKGINMILVGFIVLILGVVFIGAISDYVYEAVNPFGQTNESIEFNTSRISGADNNLNESLQFVLQETEVFDINQIQLFNGSILTEDTDWNHTDEYITYLNSTFMKNISGLDHNLSLVTYEYTSEGYVDHSIARIFINLLPLFFAIAILLAILYFVMRDTELFERFKGSLGK